MLADFTGRHWRGQLSLALSIVVGLLLIRVALGEIQSLTPIALLPLFVLISAAILVWQVVGGWRAIESHTRAVGNMAMVWAGYAAIVVVLALTLMQTLDALARRADPPSPPGGEPYVEFTLPVDAVERSATIAGAVGWPHHTALKTLLESDRPIERVLLHSEGGLVMAARSIADLIIEHRLDTHVEGQCFSACALIFLAGDDRSLADGASLGFHQYALKSMIRIAGIDIAEELDRDRRYLASRGVSAAFVGEVFQAGADSMWIPGLDALRDAGVVTRP